MSAQVDHVEGVQQAGDERNHATHTENRTAKFQNEYLPPGEVPANSPQPRRSASAMPVACSLRTRDDAYRYIRKPSPIPQADMSSATTVNDNQRTILDVLRGSNVNGVHFH